MSSSKPGGSRDRSLNGNGTPRGGGKRLGPRYIGFEWGRPDLCDAAKRASPRSKRAGSNLGAVHDRTARTQGGVLRADRARHELARHQLAIPQKRHGALVRAAAKSCSAPRSARSTVSERLPRATAPGNGGPSACRDQKGPKVMTSCGEIPLRADGGLRRCGFFILLQHWSRRRHPRDAACH